MKKIENLSILMIVKSSDSKRLGLSLMCKIMAEAELEVELEI
ncbi:hypothetical protein [Borrelia sp. RT1S]|nr:hypothetical protein [Borrelia sp. RT1S]WLT67909.1 hypothetical protein LSO05_06230 [Borrelia sp. RT1S]